ncbi:MAG: phage major capsid protein [Hyphomicrobiaceae bacterium]
MKQAEIIERRKFIETEVNGILANDQITAEQEARASELLDELKDLNQKRSAAELREKFASHAATSKVVAEKREQAIEWRSSPEYREQFLGYLKGGRAPEQREIISSASSSVLIPKIYEDGILKYLDANTVVRNLADLRTGVQGYPALRYNSLATADYTSAWTQPDTATTARTSIDPAFVEVPIAPVPCLPYTQVSQQLIRQANFDVEAEVMDSLQRQLAKNLEWGYVGGSGTNAPTGIFTVNANVNITTATSTGTTRALAVAQATVANLSNMRYSKLPAAYWGSAAWILPQDVYATIAGILVNNVPIFVPSADAAGTQAAPFTLMGLPVYVTEYLPAHVATATSGKNVVAVLGNISEGFSVREWGGVGMIRDEITAASSARVIFQGMAFANSAFTRVKSLVQLQVTNA